MKTPETVEEFVRATAPTTVQIPAWVADEMAQLPRRFTGKIQINFLEGGITNINIERSVRRPT